MKNHRGTALASVRSAVWKTFGTSKLPPLNTSASAQDIIAWKQSSETIACFDCLFEKNADDVFWVTIIARATFTEAAVPNLTSCHCAFTLAVCDILLNPASKSTTCTEKRMKRRMDRYIVSLRYNSKV